MAVAAYAMTVGSLRAPDVANVEVDDGAMAALVQRIPGTIEILQEANRTLTNSFSRLQGLRQWFDKHVFQWANSEHPVNDASIMEPLLEKIAWLQADGPEARAVLGEMALLEVHEAYRTAASFWGVYDIGRKPMG